MNTLTPGSWCSGCNIAVGGGDCGSIPEPVKSDTLLTATTFLWNPKRLLARQWRNQVHFTGGATV